MYEMDALVDVDGNSLCPSVSVSTLGCAHVYFVVEFVVYAGKDHEWIWMIMKLCPCYFHFYGDANFFQLVYKVVLRIIMITTA